MAVIPPEIPEASAERRAELWARAERIRIEVDAVRLTREALAEDHERTARAAPV
ncbi:hypothetical protein OG762_51650 (plasmid) [Streptomyces sp. NBC_01136]|uniref:hypothetical protein n=1 Tax=Streptomyces sp. NBC_01136 TaxID=2903754 RepID=UPI002F912C89|nr:hypothetical protein OG762_51650 [Streptomyces sp. NBC_01136]